jgi:peptidoglycan/xylan/chitin deacetylase (PgdA/CDA1 family)
MKDAHGQPACRRMPILTYHSIDSSGSVISVEPVLFADQMRWLAEAGLRGVSLSEAVSHHTKNGHWPEGKVVLTFDDGYRNFYDLAFPVLGRHGFTATAFVVSGHMGGYNDWSPPPGGLGASPILSWRQTIELSAQGIEIGAHTRTHPDLRRISRARVEDEIIASRLEIEDQIQKPVLSFAYPYGRTSKLSVGIATTTYRAACGTSLGRARGDALHRLSRVDMYYIRTRDSLERLVTGRLDSYLSLRRWIRRARGN